MLRIEATVIGACILGIGTALFAQGPASLTLDAASPTRFFRGSSVSVWAVAEAQRTPATIAWGDIEVKGVASLAATPRAAARRIDAGLHQIVEQPGRGQSTYVWACAMATCEARIQAESIGVDVTPDYSDDVPASWSELVAERSTSRQGVITRGALELRTCGRDGRPHGIEAESVPFGCFYYELPNAGSPSLHVVMERRVAAAQVAVTGPVFSRQQVAARDKY